MYVEQTNTGFNIMDIPAELMPAIQTAIRNQFLKVNDEELAKEEKRELRRLNHLIETEMVV